MVYKSYARRGGYSRRKPAFTRYKRTYKKKRFTNKRFNNRNQLTLRPPIASRLLRVKLPWIKVLTPTITGSNSQSYYFQGNALVPQTSTGATGLNQNVKPGDILPAGAIEYSNLYDRYYVNGSSISVEIINTLSQNGGALKCVLLAVPFVFLDSSSPEGDNWPAVRDQLDGYSYDQLLAWPYAKWRMLGSDSGGASRLKFKMFRKTKNMCSKAFLRDNNYFGSQLPDGTSSFPSTGYFINPPAGFMYYLRMFNTKADVAVPEVTVKMSLYFTMTNREFNPTTTVLLEQA